jgi:hypothetical protein
MPDQAITRRHTTGDIVLPGTTGFQVELTEEQLRQMAAVTKTLIVETDGLNQDVEAHVLKPGRSVTNQQSIEAFAAAVVTNFQRAAIGVQAQAFVAIMDKQPREQVTRIIEVPQRGLLPRLLGRWACMSPSLTSGWSA